MEITEADSLWVMWVAPKCSGVFSSPLPFLASILFLLCFARLIKSLLCWAYAGGPAWGRYHHHRQFRQGSPPRRVIPGPRGLPFIGSMPLMTGLAHRRLAHAAECHRARRLMGFSLGETRAVVTCDPDVAREILHSPVFAERPLQESARGLMFDRAIGFAPHGPYWRSLRRLSALHLFSPGKVAASETRRFAIAAQMVSEISRRKGQRFEVRELLKRASLKNMMGSLFGGAGDGEAEELERLVGEGYRVLGSMNFSDHLPWLAPLDLQGFRSRCSRLAPKVKRFMNRIISEHRKAPGKSDSGFLDVLLSLPEPDKPSDENVIAVVWEMIFRGTDVVAVAVEWVLARMVLHPGVQSRVQEELDRVAGASQSITDSGIASAVYLPAVVKEVLRIHPPGPLLSWARMAATDTTVAGYDVPAGTTAMVNMWAIARDPRLWEAPLEFRPERFLPGGGAEGVCVGGSDLTLAPFGSGRRACPGRSLGLATVVCWVAKLLHEFRWAAPPSGEADLSEVLRLSCEMARPLAVEARRRR